MNEKNSTVPDLLKERDALFLEFGRLEYEKQIIQSHLNEVNEKYSNTLLRIRQLEFILENRNESTDTLT